VYCTCQGCVWCRSQLRGNVDFIPLRIRKLLVQTLVFSRIDYALPLLTDASQGNIEKLQRVQNAAVRFISYIPRRDHITPLYQSLRILKIEQRIKTKVAMFIWKIMKFKIPLYLYKIFCDLTKLNKKTTRQGMSMINIPTHQTSKYNRSFVVTACRMFNELNIYDVLNLKAGSYKQFLLSQIVS